MAKQVIGAQVDVEFQSVGNLRKAIKEANSELLKTQAAFGATSKEAIEAAKRVAGLRDSLKEANEVADLFDPGNKFKAVGNAVTALASGFSAVQGAMGLLGVESKEVEKQLLRVQSALALSQGLSGILDSQKDFVRLASIIKGQVVAAFTTLRGAIIATGIGALVVAVAALIANFDKLKNLLDGVSDSQKDFAKTSKQIADTEEKKLETLDNQDNILKLQGKSEKQILDLKIKQTEEVIQLREQQLKAAKELRDQQIAGAKRNQDFLAGAINFLTKPLQLLLEAGNKVANIFGRGVSPEQLQKSIEETTKRIAGVVFDPKQVAEEANAGIEEIEKEILNLRNRSAGFQLAQRGSGTKGKTVLDLIYPEIRNKDRQKEIIDEVVPEFQSLIETVASRLSEVAVNPELEKIRRSLLLTPEQNDLATLQDYYNSQFELVKGNQVLELELTEQFEKQKTDITRFYNQQRLQIVSSLLGQASDVIGRQTAAGKTLAIAEATINTYLSATKAYNSLAGIPVVGPALGAVAAGLAVASGLKSIREIARTKVPGQSGGGVPNISTGAPLTPQLSPQAQGQALNAAAINNLQQNPTRAYILDRDIQNQNQINSFITRNANI